MIDSENEKKRSPHLNQPNSSVFKLKALFHQNIHPPVRETTTKQKTHLPKLKNVSKTEPLIEKYKKKEDRKFPEMQRGRLYEKLKDFHKKVYKSPEEKN